MTPYGMWYRVVMLTDHTQYMWAERGNSLIRSRFIELSKLIGYCSSAATIQDQCLIKYMVL